MRSIYENSKIVYLLTSVVTMSSKRTPSSIDALIVLRATQAVSVLSALRMEITR